MTRISPDLLSDTYHLIQLARETARASGRQDQAERLSPLVDDLRSLVKAAQEPRVQAPLAQEPKTAGLAGAGPQTPAPVSGPLAQEDFRKLLQAVQGRNGSQAAPSASPAERNGVVLAMAAGGMGELDIARQMGMTREEVDLVMRLSKK